MSKVFELPAGLWRGDKPEKEVRLTELTARIRKEMGNPTVRNNPVQVVSSVLVGCIESIGGVPVTERDLDNMLTGDRDFCLLKIREISLGSDVNTSFNCPICSGHNRSVIDLQSIAVYDLDEANYEIRPDLEPDPRVYRVKKEGSWEAIFRFPTGMDQKIVMKGANKNPLATQQDLFSRCLLEWNGEKVFPEHLDNLPIPELNFLEGEIMDALPGPDFNAEVECSLCGAKVPMPMESSDFLFPEDLGKRSGRRLKKR